MLGYKVFLQDGGDIHEGLTCSYYKLVLKDPVQNSESGQRLCRECFDKATKDSLVGGLDPNDKVWLDSAVKREIANHKVKCENYMVGCDWKGLFKQPMQHSQECQYVTGECRNPGYGQKVPLTEMDEHLKECPQRHVNCKDCGKEMCFIKLQEHAAECPNAPKACKNCKKKMPASKLADHMIHECKHIRCVCARMMGRLMRLAVESSMIIFKMLVNLLIIWGQ